MTAMITCGSRVSCSGSGKEVPSNLIYYLAFFWFFANSIFKFIYVYFYLKKFRMEEEAGTREQEGWRELTKCKALSGTFDSGAFQLQVLWPERENVSATPPDGGEETEGGPSQGAMGLVTRDPLAVPLFDVLGYHCVPHCGVYAQDDYEPSLPFVLLSLPFELLQRSLAMPGGPVALPYRLREELLGPAASYFTTSSSSFYVMVHPIPPMKECQHFMCDSRREVNVITHAWTFPDVQFTPQLEVLNPRPCF
jgi:hypothetical protein